MNSQIRKVQSAKWQEGLVAEISLLDPRFTLDEKAIATVPLDRYLPGTAVLGSGIVFLNFTFVQPFITVTTTYTVPANKVALVTGFFFSGVIQVAAAILFQVSFSIQTAAATVRLLGGLERDAMAVGAFADLMSATRAWLRSGDTLISSVALTGAVGSAVRGSIGLSVYEFAAGVWPRV